VVTILMGHTEVLVGCRVLVRRNTYTSLKTLCESPRVVRLCAYGVVKTATPISTTTSDTLAIGGIIFMTFGLGGLPSLDCFVK
jgi:hypothetical protein